MTSIDWGFIRASLFSRRSQSVLLAALVLIVGLARISADNPQVQYLMISIYFCVAVLFLLRLVIARQKLILPHGAAFFAAYVGLMFILIPFTPLPRHGLTIATNLAWLLLASVLLTTASKYWVHPLVLENSVLLLGVLFTVVNLIFVVRWAIPFVSLMLDPAAAVPFGFRLPGGFLGHANLEAGYLGLVLPLGVARFVAAKPGRDRMIWGIPVLMFSTVLFFSSSRAGWGAAGVGVGCTLIMFLLGGVTERGVLARVRQVIAWLRGRPAIVLSGSIVILIVSVSLWVQAANTPHAPLLEARGHTWRAGLQAFLQSPWIGRGPGSTHVSVLQQDRFLSEAYFIHPHNILLMIADEGGLVGLGLVAIGVALTLVPAIRLLANANPSTRAAYAGVFGGLAAAAIHNQADVLFEAPGYALSFVILVSAFFSLLETNRADDSRRIPVGVAAITCLLVLLSQLLALRGLSRSYKAMARFQNNLSAGSLDSLCSAAETPPELAANYLNCGLAIAALHPQDLAQLQAAAMRLERAVELDPYWPYHWLNLAAVQHAIGESELAAAAIDEAALRATEDARILTNLGWFLEQAGDLEGASHAYESAVIANPGLVDSLFYQGTDVRAIATSFNNQMQFQNDAERSALLGWSLWNTGEMERASNAFTQSLRLSARQQLARTGLARLALDSGDSESAQRLVRIVEIAGSQDARVLLNAGLIAARLGLDDRAAALFAQGWQSLASTNSSVRYYSIVYRVPTLDTDIVPHAVDPELTIDMAEALESYAALEQSRGDTTTAIAIESYLSHAIAPPHP